jgi:hypothetical protein
LPTVRMEYGSKGASEVRAIEGKGNPDAAASANI